ncbi:MAG: 2-oxo acid dehydrogenase subunit E2 [Oscillospiraceae bacterium]|nr:2-oxo acid dehydrogenase subunit E2 [Oscillospiraceae bacterium]
MATELIMPKAGMAMEEGKIVRWLKEVGDPIEAGEGVMEIETDKITMENESPASGVLLAKYYGDGDVVPVTVVIGYVGEPGEQVPDAPVPSAASPAPASSEPALSAPDAPFPEPVPALPVRVREVSPITPPSPQLSSADIPATPYAKTLAAEAGVDLRTLAGSGAGGVVKARDVQKATPLAARMAADRGIDLGTVTGTGFGGKIRSADLAGAVSKPAASGSAIPLAGMRAVIANRMTSAAQIPTVTQSMKAYMDDLLALRVRANEGREEKITINDFILKSCAKTVAGSDLFRTEIDMAKGQLIVRARTNIAVAVALDEGLMVPVIQDADRLTLTELSARAKDLAARARAGKLSPDECMGSVFTVSNLGASGVLAFTPILNEPNAAILGIGSIHEELALIDGAVAARKFVMLSLTYDHRIIDGAAATAFQRQIKGLLENPVEMLI